MVDSELEELNNRQIFKFDGESLVLAYVNLKRPVDTYFNISWPKAASERLIFNIFDINEFTMKIDFPYRDVSLCDCII